MSQQIIFGENRHAVSQQIIFGENRYAVAQQIIFGENQHAVAQQIIFGENRHAVSVPYFSKMKLYWAVWAVGGFLGWGCRTPEKSLGVGQRTKEGEAPRVQVSGTLTESHPYCGGAYPGEEELRRLNAARPLQTWLYIRSGTVNRENARIMDSTQTNAEGRFLFDLPPGSYVILLPEHKKHQAVDALLQQSGRDITVDRACLETWWEKGLMTVDVQSGTPLQGLDVHLRHACFVPYPPHCFNYTGPYPP